VARRAGKKRARRWIHASFGASIALLACNQILGVEDVHLAPPRTRDDVVPDSGHFTGDDDDGSTIITNPDGNTTGQKDVGTIALGFLHGCGRTPSGAVKCWGDNGAGQLGDGIPFDQPDRPASTMTPQAVPGIANAVDVCSGVAHSCAALQDGTVHCWGLNTFGQLGDGTQNRSPGAVQVVGITDAASLACGQSFVCAIRKDATVSCWGANYGGQFGDGDKTTDAGVAVAPVTGLTGVRALSAGYAHACAVVQSGDLYCWGANDQGQLGIGSTAESLTPTKLVALSDVIQVAAGGSSNSSFTCARESSGKVYCWGSNAFGQLGNGTPNTDPNPSPILVPAIDDAAFLSIGNEHACAVRARGTILCWGHDDAGQLGVGGDSPDGAIPTPSQVVNLPSPTAIRVATGGQSSCALTKSGAAFCWGANGSGQLGIGAATNPVSSATAMVSFP
jgi:alpha-tubulin suppressor-like RCC1 family protein